MVWAHPTWSTWTSPLSPTARTSVLPTRQNLTSLQEELLQLPRVTRGSQLLTLLGTFKGPYLHSLIDSGTSLTFVSDRLESFYPCWGKACWRGCAGFCNETKPQNLFSFGLSLIGLMSSLMIRLSLIQDPWLHPSWQLGTESASAPNPCLIIFNFSWLL